MRLFVLSLVVLLTPSTGVTFSKVHCRLYQLRSSDVVKDQYIRHNAPQLVSRYSTSTHALNDQYIMLVNRLAEKKKDISIYLIY